MANKTMLYSLKVGTFVAKVIPRNIGTKIAYSCAYSYGLLPTKLHKRIAKIHQKISPGITRKQLRHRVAAVLASYAFYWWDVFWISSDRKISELDKIVTLENKTYFEQALEQTKKSGKGIIFVTPHIGSWEIPAAWLSANGYKPTVVAERLKPPELFEQFLKTRTKAGMNVIAHDDHPSAKLLSTLNAGQLICLVADRDMSKRGVEVTFFGKKKSMPTGPGALSLKTGSWILPVCMYVSNTGKVEVTFFEPIKPPENLDDKSRDDTILGITQKVSKILEEMIARDPTQWHVLYDEWSTDG